MDVDCPRGSIPRHFCRCELPGGRHAVLNWDLDVRVWQPHGLRRRIDVSAPNAGLGSPEIPGVNPFNAPGYRPCSIVRGHDLSNAGMPSAAGKPPTGQTVQSSWSGHHRSNSRPGWLFHSCIRSRLADPRVCTSGCDPPSKPTRIGDFEDALGGCGDAAEDRPGYIHPGRWVWAVHVLLECGTLSSDYRVCPSQQVQR